MKTMLYRVDKRFCGDCSLALRRFLQGIDGVAGVDFGNDSISVSFDEAVIGESAVDTLARNSIERLGYRIAE